MKKYIVEINDNEYEVTIREKGEKKTKSNSISSSKTNETKKESNNIKNENSKTSTVQKTVENDVDPGNKEVVSAPMSGKILSIRVNEGDNVEKNQVLMTLEAMKMETEIVAPVKGNIEKIIAVEGSKCKQGDKLALIEAGGN